MIQTSDAAVINLHLFIVLTFMKIIKYGRPSLFRRSHSLSTPSGWRVQRAEVFLWFYFVSALSSSSPVLSLSSTFPLLPLRAKNQSQEGGLITSHLRGEVRSGQSVGRGGLAGGSCCFSRMRMEVLWVISSSVWEIGVYKGAQLMKMEFLVLVHISGIRDLWSSRVYF